VPKLTCRPTLEWGGRLSDLGSRTARWSRLHERGRPQFWVWNRVASIASVRRPSVSGLAVSKARRLKTVSTELSQRLTELSVQAAGIYAAPLAAPRRRARRPDPGLCAPRRRLPRRPAPRLDRRSQVVQRPRRLDLCGHERDPAEHHGQGGVGVVRHRTGRF
jgi:hypothetical protein